MDDLISRLSELRSQYNLFDENEHGAYHTLSEAIKAINALEQPELHYDEWCETCKEYDAENHRCPRFNKVIKAMVQEYKASMPVRCKDCKYYDGRPCGKVDWYNTADDFCSKAERRTDG